MSSNTTVVFSDFSLLSCFFGFDFSIGWGLTRLGHHWRSVWAGVPGDMDTAVYAEIQHEIDRQICTAGNLPQGLPLLLDSRVWGSFQANHH